MKFIRQLSLGRLARAAAATAALTVMPCVIATAQALQAHARVQSDTVTLWKLPAGSIQPQAAVDSKGVVHIVYFKGDDKAGNLFYIHRAPGESAPSNPIQVNSEPNTAGAIGTVRVANIAIGEGDSIHIVWNGLGPKGPGGYPQTYAAYTRLVGGVFEAQRNLTTWATGLDGGSSLAADNNGNVYVVWHAMARSRDESGRAVYVARSVNGGKTFSREEKANSEPTGACGCCGLRASVDSRGMLYVLYRSAEEKVHRDTMLLTSADKGASFQEQLLDRWNIDTCPMSTYALNRGAERMTAAWETSGRIYFSTLSSGRQLSIAIRTDGDRQKHPTLAANAAGETLIAWTEGTGWQKGGSLAWQVYDAFGRPTESKGRSGGVPVWGLPSAYALPDGRFVIVY